MLAILILGIYFGGMIAFAAWDAYIGFGVEFDGDDWPPMFLALTFWPLTLVAAIVAAIGGFMGNAKSARNERQKEQKRIRIAAEQERDTLLAEIEKEMFDDAVHVGNSSSNRKKTRSR
jgi:hypothetical protein